MSSTDKSYQKTAQNAIPKTLNESHRAILTEKSAIAPNIIAARGYFSTPEVSEKEDGTPDYSAFWQVWEESFHDMQHQGSGLFLPSFRLNGEPAAPEFRVDTPFVNHEGKEQRYIFRAGAHRTPDINPLVQPMLADVNKPLWFTEGGKKADALASQGVCAIALPGVWGFAKPDTKCTELHPDFTGIPLKERTTYIAYDSDVTSNRLVRQARQKFTTLLTEAGAVVKWITLPTGVNGTKQGVDDFLANGGTIKALESLATVPTVSEFFPTDEGIFRRALDEKGAVTSKLCNALVFIDKTIVKHSTSDATNDFEIVAYINGLERRTRIDASEFSSLNFIVPAFGGDVVITAGAEKQLRQAIQELSNERGKEAKNIYTHVGLRVIDGEMSYLFNGGRITAQGIKPLDVEL